MTAHAMSLIRDAGDLPDYPISTRDRLDSHYFIQWNLKRWRGSEFRRTVDPEVGWYGFQLFCIAQDETPIGTLPCDDKQLAYELRLPLERWQDLLKRPVNPLHNWSRVRCDNGDIRLAHPVVTEVAIEALKSKRKNSERQEERRRNKQRKDLSMMITKIGAKQLLSNPQFIDSFLDWLDEHRAGQQRREAMIREALDEFIAGNCD